MTHRRQGITLRYKNRVYVVNPEFPLVREVEQELGSIAALSERFLNMGWKISELVTITHMMLQAAGETVDYLSLGNQMLREGLGNYLLSAQSFLKLLIYGGDAP